VATEQEQPARPDLAAELLALAEEDERAVHDFFAAALADPGLTSELLDHVGWHPGQDPIDVWESSERAPTPIWMVDWPDPPPAVQVLVATVTSHTEWFRATVRRRGWPGRRMVGEDGADAAWFLAMHADQDPVFQDRCVTLLGDALLAEEADPRHYVGLVDRIRSVTRGRQVYGTLAVPGDDGVVYLVPVEDETVVDERRFRLGVPTVAADLAAGPGQLPYRHLRRSPSFQWPRRRVTTETLK
jgi:hypothetical protein